MLYFRDAVRRRERAVEIWVVCLWGGVWSHSWGYMKRRSWIAVLFVERVLKKRIAEQMFEGSGVERSWR